MRYAIYSGIAGLVAGILIGVYVIAPAPETESADEGGFARESKVEQAVASAERKQSIVIGTGHVRSAYHSAGVGICRFVNKGTAEHGVACETRNTQGRHREHRRPAAPGRQGRAHHGPGPGPLGEPRP